VVTTTMDADITGAREDGSNDRGEKGKR